MVGKNNKFLKENKNNQRFLRFSLRKLSVGVVSVAIAAGFYVGGSQSVLADTTSTDPVVRQNAPNDDSTVNTDKNTVNQQSASTSADSSAVAGAADSTAAEAVKSAASAAEQQKTTTLNVAEAKPAAASKTANLLYNKAKLNVAEAKPAAASKTANLLYNKAKLNVAEAKPAAASKTANLLYNKAQSSAVSDAASTVNDDDLLKNIKISNPTDPNFVQYQDLVDSYMSYNYGEEKPSQYVFSVINDSRIDTDFIWTVDQDTGEKVSVYFNNWDRRITGHHQFNDDDFDDNHNDYRYSKYGVTLSYDKPEGSSGSISVVDDHHNIWNLGNLQDVYEINGSTDNSRSDSFAITLPEKGQPIIKFLYRNPDTGKLMDLRAPIYYSNGLTGQKFELDIGDSYKQGLKDMFAGFKLVGSSKASGTFTQFAQGKTYVEHDASDDSEVIYQQIDAEGTMKVFYREKDGEKQPLLDKHGNPYQLEAGSSVKIDTGNGIITAYNPFVTGDHAYELIYEPEDQSANIVYVDKDRKVVKTDTVNGKTTQTVDVKSNVPAGWVLVKGQHDAPATITFTGAHTDDITIKIEHGKTSVDHNHPVNPGDKTPSGKVIDGAHESDLNQTITRTVNITEPGQATKTTTQVAHIYRDATVDDVTGEVTYSAWSTDSADWTAVNVPSHAGYTAHQSDGQTGIPVVTVKDGQKDVKIDVTYTPDEQKGQITYVDEKGKQISSTPLTGKTDEDIAINPVAPAGWELVPGQKYPATVTAKADGIPDVTLKVRHHMINVVPGDLPNPGDKKPGNNDKKPGDGTPNKDITHEDLNKTITRTFIVKAPTGTMTKTQHISYQRTATIDDVTGDVTFSDWNTDGASFKAEVIPAISGYTSHVTEGNYGAYAPSQDQINNWTDPMITVTYTANDQSQVINYVDDHNKTIKTDTVKGKTDETVNVTPSVPDHYELVPGQNIPSEVTLKDKNTPIIVKVQPKVDSITDPAKLNKSISRTITINKPGEKPQVINQHADFTRTGQYNEVTGATVYTDWTLKGNTLEAVDAPAVPGYTPNVAHVDSVDNPTTNTKLTDVTINYTANSQTTHINYVDKDGEAVKSDTVSGKTDETVKTNSEVPAGWVLVKGQHDAPATITFTGAHTDDITIKIEHGKTSVDHNHPVNPGDKTPSGKVIDGAHESDLNQTITRTVNITEPGQATKTTTQVAHIYRDATVDDVTGEVTYSAWSTDSADWTAVNVPSHAGYTAHQSDGQTGIPVVTVKDGQKDVKIDVTYTPDEQKGQITYVDEKGKQISSTPLTGKTDEDIAINPVAPAGWELVPGQKYPATVTAKADGIPDVTLKVRHHMINVVPGDLPNPGDKKPGNNDKKPGDGTPNKDITHEDLNKTITRTFIVKAPTGTMTKTQHISYQRTATIDDVTGDVTFSDWNTDGASFKAEVIPAISGYTSHVTEGNYGAYAPSQDQINNWTDPMITVTYTANDQSQVINYVDDHNKTIKTDTVKGKTDETVNVTPSVPDHYELVPGQNIPSEVTLKDKNTPIIVKVQPKVDSITDPAKLNKSISRTITINKPGEKPQVINQHADFTRTGQYNEVTGATVYTDWTLKGNTLEAVDAPAVPGYTPNVAHVDSVDNPTTNTKLTDVTINYTANSQTTHINYVDKDGEAVKSDTVSGKTDETVKTNSEVPAGWKITDGQIPETIHFTGEETPDTTITIEHDTTSVDHIKPVKPGDKTPSGKVIDGAHESDLNQTITRTINVTTPDGQTTTTKQVAKIFRDATIDDVTGEVTYGSWSEDTWADFKPGQLAGCTASQADVPAVTVKDGQKDQTVDITYTANEGTVLIKYVDRDGNEIGQQVITGHVGDTIKVTPQFPENWVPVDPDTVPAEVQIKEENGQIIIVVVRHDEKDSVQTKKVTRTIMVTTPDGQTKTIKQVVTISRHGSLDLVTGQIAWQPWTTAQWDVFKPAAIAGYIPSPAEVPAVTVDGETTDQTVDITYAAVATPAQQGHQAPTASDTPDAQQATNQKADSNAQPAVTVVTSQQTATAQQGHQAPTASDTPDAQQATNQKADSNAQPAVTVVTSQQTATAQQVESTTNSRRLPQTGNSYDASALAGLGLALASLMGLFGLGGKRRKRD